MRPQRTFNRFLFGVCGSLAAFSVFSRVAVRAQPSANPSSAIVFVSSRDGNSEIYIMNADGSGQTRLTRNPDFERQPALSPDGRKIVFMRYPPARGTSDNEESVAAAGEIYTMNVDGTQVTRLTKNVWPESDPSWSPDSHRIAFHSERGGNAERVGNDDIYLIGADGSGERRLTNHRAHDFAPSWTLDGSAILFVSDRSGSVRGGSVRSGDEPLQIFRMNLGDRSLQQLSFSANSKTHPRQSPDGKWIAFEAAIPDNTGLMRSRIMVMCADGSQGHLLIGEKSPFRPEELHPWWSPDSRRVAYTKGGEGFGGAGVDRQGFSNGIGDPNEVQVTALDRSDSRSLTLNNVLDAEPSWGLGSVPLQPIAKPSPGGGGKIVFVAAAMNARGDFEGEASALYTINPDGTALTRLKARGKTEYQSVGWSPDERHIIVTRADWERRSKDPNSLNETPSDIYLLRADGSFERRLTRTGRAFSPVLRPDGQKILFQSSGLSDDEDPGGIYEMNPDGSGRHLLLRRPAPWKNSGWGHDFTWSPDARHIAFVSAGGGYDQIWRMKADGSELVRLPNGEERMETSPHFSPDGRRLVYAASGEDITEYSLRIVDCDGTHDRALVDDNYPNSVPSWSPDGRKIIFVSERGYGLQLYAVNPDGSHLAPLTHGPRQMATAPHGYFLPVAPALRPVYNPKPLPRIQPVSSAGKIVFSSARAPQSGSEALWMMNPDGSRLTQIKSFPHNGYSASAFEPVISPDGRKVAFCLDVNSREASGQDIEVVNIDGTDPAASHLTASDKPNQPDRNAHPSWSPDGRRIVYDAHLGEIHGRYTNYHRPASDREIWVMNADGSGKMALTRNKAQDFQPSWSPDGRRIAFVSNRSGNNEIYGMNADGSAQTRLTHHPADDIEPAWSPDSRRLAFTSRREGNLEIYVMNANGSKVRRLTRHARSDSRPAWSRDGRRIIWQSQRGETLPGGKEELMIAKSDGSGQKPLTRHAGFDGHPSFGPALK